MACMFNGIMNDDGIEHKMRLALQFVSNLPVVIDLFIDNEKKDVIINTEKMIIDEIEYLYCVKKTDDEILIAGKEIENFFQFVAPCLFKPKYFVLTNKEEI